MSLETRSPKSVQRNRGMGKKRVDSEGNTPFQKLNMGVIESKELHLHPTKGFRRLSTVATAASDITQSILSGNPITFEQMKNGMIAAFKGQYKNKETFNAVRRTKP